MHDAMLEAVLIQAPDISLDQLEADIWAGVKARGDAGRTGTILVVGQLIFMSLALMGGLTIGSAAVQASPSRPESLARLGSADLAPSTLLTGR